VGVVSSRLRLAIDASAGPASVALFLDEVLVQSRRIDRQGSAELLAPTVADVLRAAGKAASELTDVIVGGGPGSFTGIRVAAALGKGLARGAGAALFAVPSLPLIAASNDAAPPGLYFTVLDALRGEWFLQPVTRRADGRWNVDGPVERIAAAQVRERATSLGATLAGPPISALHQPDARASLLVGVSPVDLDTWEPEYGRLAEAQVLWEAANARPLPAS
jgi:tRNA threonylcarbamoyladenosine biosynthesis protein TsaB